MILDLAGRLFRRFRPREGWPIFGLAVTALLCPAAALVQATEGLGAGRLLILAALAVLTGLALARSRLSGGWAAGIGGLTGIALVAAAIGDLLPPLWLVGREIGYLVPWLRSWWQGSPLSPAPFSTVAVLIWQHTSAFGVRVAAWLDTVASGSEAQDRIGFLLLVGLVVWTVALIGGWQVFRRRAALRGLVPSGLALAVLVFLTRQGATFLFIYLFCTLALVAALHLWTRQQHWEATDTDYPVDLGVDLAMVILPWLTVVVVLTTVFPMIRARQVSKAFWRMVDRPWSAVEQVSGRLFGEIQDVAPDSLGAGGLPQEHLLGGRPDLGQTVVLTVRTNDPAPLPPELEEYGMPVVIPPRRYWRGAVYDIYTGLGWDKSPMQDRSYAVDQPLFPELPPGFELRQEFEIVEPQGDIAYAANAPFSVDQPVRGWWWPTGDLVQIESNARRYTVISRPPEPTAAELRAAPPTIPPNVAQRYLTLPDSVPGRVRDLAQEIVAGSATRYDQARALEGYLRTYTYTLDVPTPPPNRDLVDWFLFDLQAGYCDYYASAMAVMARSVGIPARFASGYSQGSFDSQTGRWVVAELNGHSWVEIYFEGIGWVEFEPTRGVPPVARPGGEGGPAGVPPPRPPGLLGGRVPWPLAALAAAIVLLVALVAWLWLGRGRPAPTAAGTIRDRFARLQRWGRRLGHSHRDGQTAYEYGAGLAAGLADRGATSRWEATRAAAGQAPAEIDELAGHFVRAQYGRGPVAEREGWRVHSLWLRLRQHLWWLWISRRP